MSNAPRLRAVTAPDHERLRLWRNTPEVARHMYADHVISPEEHAAWLARALADPARRYWIVELEGRAVGLASLADVNAAARRCSWAFYLADPATRGRGLGTWIEYAVLAHVFETLKLGKLWCEVLVENEAVWRLHESVGFTPEARLRAHVVKAGTPRDVIGLGMLAEDWALRRDALAERVRAKGYAPAPAPVVPPMLTVEAAPPTRG